MKVTLNTTQLEKNLFNLVEYSVGFVEGIHKGKFEFFKILGAGVLKALNQYIDTTARMEPQLMHHVYEWYQVGSPKARLFDIKYTPTANGISFKSSFRQSSTLSHTSMEPFINKAQIMEEGRSITVEPRVSRALAFEVNGEQIFTTNPVTINNPGGDGVAGSFERVFDEFFLIYFKQSFLRASGVYDYLRNPMLYKKNFASGVKGGGKAVGTKTGYTWIVNASLGVVD